MEYNIETLMREYGNDVLRTAYSYVKDKFTAEDIFQEVFIKAYKSLDSFRNESSVKTWLIRITINAAKDYLKSAYNQKVVPMMDFKEDMLTSEDDFEEIENRDRDEQIRNTVMNLPEQYREVLLCVYYHDMSVAETAKSLNIAEGTVKSRLSRARDLMKNKLEGRL
ncbi:MAG: sigma-70 family RNA polymerase sigma factor [Lachnospiraceae bacterium]|jgi:RNA polymerase sigma-70 factor (ECF subfamily)|nr:sigma-70 family RNA polymerase sigma factor [Lachnospiraceae bacterium]